MLGRGFSEMKDKESLHVFATLALVAAVVVAVVLFERYRGNSPDKGSAVAEGGRSERRVSDGRGKEAPLRQTAPEVHPADEDSQTVEEPASNADDEESAESTTTSPDPIDIENARVEEFDNATDKWTNPVDGEISMKDVYAFADTFARVPKNRKQESLQRALNLIPDENIMILAGLLMDKHLDNEYLMAVFNDVLNRSDEVKQPLLNEIYKDKDHPCWAEVAWIFDATGQKDNKNTK